MKDGLRRMYGENPEDVFYYLTVYNEPLAQPPAPADLDVEGLLKGIYRLSAAAEGPGPRAQLLASGVSVPWTLEAQRLLADDWGVRADVWSVTSWTELRRDAMACDDQAFRHPQEEPRAPFVTSALQGAVGPVVAVTDYVRAVPDQIRQWVPEEFVSLGADGFGISDTRAAARRYFGIDSPSVVVRTLELLAGRGEIDPATPQRAIEKYQLLDVRAGTTGNAGGDA
jgi:pyruvate dehydrogenase E1 component